MPNLTIRNESLFIEMVGSPESLWVYSGPHPRKIAPPAFEIDGVTRVAALKGIRECARPAALANGCTEYRFEGTFADDPALSLEMVFRLAPENPVVRFRYVLKSREPKRLTKPESGDRLSYLSVALGGSKTLKEVRLSEFDELLHSYTCREREVKDGDFDAGLSVMGPILTATEEGESALLAYEHGSTVAFAFIEFALNPSRCVTMRAVRGNYSNGQWLDPAHPFETIWLDFAVVPDNEEMLAAAFREFLLKYQPLSPATRRPLVFYNTWCFQERNKWLNGRTYVDSMNERRILDEIDAAAKMGIEVFVLDAGWYDRPGDWNAHPKRFPNGLGPIRERLDSHGMKLGLWFAPPWAAASSRALKNHLDCLTSTGGVANPAFRGWEDEECFNLCLVSRYADAFADDLIRLNRELGVVYFKWDAVSQWGCDDPNHLHGDATLSQEERLDRFKFEQPRVLARIAGRVAEACPEAICDFDVTESHRAVGLAFLEAGKYFLVNNGPYDFNFDRPRSSDRWINVFVHPGPARARVCRGTIGFDKWIPSTLFLSHFLPDDPAESQVVNVASLVLGFGGIWGDLPGVSEEGKKLIGALVGRYKQVRDDAVEASPVRSGPVGGNPEVHEKINPRTGHGILVLFSSVEGEYHYVTTNRVAREHWADERATVSMLADGRAHVIVKFPGRHGGASIVCFGTS